MLLCVLLLCTAWSRRSGVEDESARASVGRGREGVWDVYRSFGKALGAQCFAVAHRPGKVEEDTACSCV